MAFQTVLQYVSDFLSLITIGMCLVLKVPQITKLLDSKSAVGISFLGLMLELISHSIMMSYNYTNGYSLMTYLEYPIILIQEYVLIFLVLKYLNILNSSTMLASAAYFLIFISFLMQIIPKGTLSLLAPFCTPISASSKAVQLIAILRAKNADSISPKTWFISAFTNLTRLFTILMDSADTLLLGNYIISLFLSTSILCSVIYYRTNKVE